MPESLEGLEHPICGTPLAFEYFVNYDKLDGVYKFRAGKSLARDPELAYSYGSPSGHFLIHYDIEGSSAVYMPTLDTLGGGDGVPDYVNKTAQILDSVWTRIIDVMGFPAPPSDDFYPEGLDDRYDVYISDWGSQYYGATYGEAIVTAQSATSYLTLDNDYNFSPYNEYTGDPRDFNRRLDAMRVTVAHEFFHAVHFGMDWTEYEGDDESNPRLYWWEMSSVWMEEMIYDGINDYYGYLPAFFNYPWIGLRNFNTSSYSLALHPYGAAVFPIYLTERWGDPTIVRRIWEECRDLGVGPNFGQAVDIAANEFSNGTLGLAGSIREFSVWNIFTGDRADLAPSGIGYSEAAFYPAIPDTAFFNFNDYPEIYTNLDLIDTFKLKITEMFGSNILNFQQTYAFPEDFNFRFYTAPLLPNPTWNVSLVGLPVASNTKATVLMNEFVPGMTGTYALTDASQYYNVLAVVSPSLTDVTTYDYRKRFEYSFAVIEEPDQDTTVFYNFDAPYPNPCLAGGGCDGVTFKVEKSITDLNPPSELDLVIYNTAGEKVREIQALGVDFGHEEITLDWDLTNASGNKVASGVYLIYWKLKFIGGDDITHKSKIAIL